jgi:hypothetical protein
MCFLALNSYYNYCFLLSGGLCGGASTGLKSLGISNPWERSLFSFKYCDIGQGSVYHVTDGHIM